MTLVHLAINFCLSALARQVMQRCTGKPRIVLSWRDYLRKVAPTGKTLAHTLFREQHIRKGLTVTSYHVQWLITLSTKHTLTKVHINKNISRFK